MIGDSRYRLSGTSFGAVKQAVSALVGSRMVTPGLVVMLPEVKSTLVPIRLVVITTGTIWAGTLAVIRLVPKGVAAHHHARIVIVVPS
jgi:hypothetical protein